VLPLLLVLVPVVGSFAVYWLGRRAGESARNLLAIGISLFCFVGAVYLFNLAQQFDVVYRVVAFLDFGLNFRVDMMGAVFALLSSFIWFLATVFSWIYMDHEHARDRYYYFLTLSLGGCLGVFLMEDLFGLLLFFEIMSLASYPLVVHVETEEAMEAGHNYLYLSIIAGLAILTGIFLLYSHAGSITFAPLLESMDFSAPLLYGIAALLIAGFGIKAGMAPLHIWLPKAHPVAPSPASALLSGIMIKTGAYGIIRVVNMLYTPSGEGGPLWLQTESLGYAIIWFGIATMFMAAFIALFQTNAKRILAFSSISQMGYILMGVGCAAFLGFGGAMGFAGTTYHIMNHAFFKAGMFMMVGAVYVRTHELELSRLGGLHREFPVTALAFLVCILGISGVPGFNGYASKTLLHHAIEDSYKYTGVISLYWAERIFTLTSAFTVCYITKLYTSIFWGRRPSGLKPMPREPLLEQVVFGVIAAGIVLMGVFPNELLSRVVIPASRGFVYDSGNLGYVAEINLFAAYDLQNIAVAVGLGLLLFAVLTKTGAFGYRPPGWLSVESLVYLPAIKGLMGVFTFAGRQLETVVDGVIVNPVAPLYRVSQKAARWDEQLSPGFIEPSLKALNGAYTFTAGLLEAGVEGVLVKSITPLDRVTKKAAHWENTLEIRYFRPALDKILHLSYAAARLDNLVEPVIFQPVLDVITRFARACAHFDESTVSRLARRTAKLAYYCRDGLYNLWIKVITAVIRSWRILSRRLFFVLIKVDYDPKDERLFQRFSMMNIDVNFIIIMAVLLLVLGLGFIMFL